MFEITEPKSSVRAVAAARAISLTGGAAAYTALQFTIYERTGSSMWVAASLLLTFGAAGLLTSPMGLLGDRLDRRKVMVASDIVAGCFFLAMALPGLPVWALLALGFASAVAEAPMIATSGAIIPALLEDEADITWGNSMVQMGVTFGIMLGPAIGGALLALLGASGVFLINAISFGGSALLIYAVRRSMAEEGSAAAARASGGAMAGMQFLLRDRALRWIGIAWFMFVLGMGMAMVADVPFAGLFGLGSFGYGMIITCWGAGSVLGSFLGRFLRARDERHALLWGSFTTAIIMIGISVSPWFLVVLVGVFFSGVGDALGMVAEQGVLQRRAPDEVRARVIGAMQTLISLAFMFSFMAAGFVTDAIGPRGAYFVAGLGALLGAILMIPAFRELGRDRVEQGTDEGGPPDASSPPVPELEFDARVVPEHEPSVPRYP